MSTRSRSVTGMALVLALSFASESFSQVDLSGQWTTRRSHEEISEALGDYSGVPLNDAARLKADSWSSSIQSVPEMQCMPHGADHMWNPPDVTGDMRIWTEKRLDTEEVVAINLLVSWMGQHRVIYMDGRPHPDEYAPHTWMGFSTGRWENNTLAVRTTHLKDRWVRRNGIPRSDQGTLTERFVRHGEYLTWITIIEDPLFLTEPFIRSVSYIFDPARPPFPAFACEVADEISLEHGEIPHFLPGANPFLTEFTTRHNLPPDASRGGAVTMYPEYAEVVRAFRRNSNASSNQR